jgi:hypothetical protein
MYLQGFLFSPPGSRDELLPVMRGLPQRLRAMSLSVEQARKSALTALHGAPLLPSVSRASSG